MRVALLQLNFTVGDLDGNADRYWSRGPSRRRRSLRDLRNGADRLSGARLVAAARFHRPDRRGLRRPRAAPQWRTACARRAPRAQSAPAGRPLFNAAALVHGGRVERQFRKSLLPTYDVFDEDRYFEPADGRRCSRSAASARRSASAKTSGTTRDFWDRPRYHHDPIDECARLGADVLLNLSASPFSVGKQRVREAMLGRIARKHAVVVYVNQVGGNDDLLFDGRSVRSTPDGALMARAAAFDEDVLVVDLDGRGARGPIAPAAGVGGAKRSSRARARHARLRAQVRLSRRAARPVGRHRLGAHRGDRRRGAGPRHVLGVLMPSPFSSDGTVDDSLALAAASASGRSRCRSPSHGAPSIARSRRRSPAAARRHRGEHPGAHPRQPADGALEQVRRAAAHDRQQVGAAVGYCTLYGDMSGGLAVIADVPKTMVYRVSRVDQHTRRPRGHSRVTLTKAPSAELRPNQTDQDRCRRTTCSTPSSSATSSAMSRPRRIVAEGFDADDRAACAAPRAPCRVQAPAGGAGPASHRAAFGTGWRMPVARADLEVLTRLRPRLTRY